MYLKHLKKQSLIFISLGLVVSSVVMASQNTKAIAEEELSVMPSSAMPAGFATVDPSIEIKAGDPGSLVRHFDREIFIGAQSYIPRGQAQVLGSERYTLDAAGKATMLNVGIFYWPWKLSPRASLGVSPAFSYSANKYPLRTSTGFFYPEIRLNNFLFSMRGALDYSLGRVVSIGALLGPGYLTASHSAMSNNTANWSSNILVLSAAAYSKFKIYESFRLAVTYERRDSLGKEKDLKVQENNVQIAALYAF